MQTLSCSICARTDVPQNTTVLLKDQVYCGPCFRAFQNSGIVIDKSDLKHAFDPTVCFSCNRDNGSEALEQISAYPVCPDCAQRMKHNILPGWVKAFFAVILLLVGFSFWWNQRFYTSYQQLKSGFTAFGQGDINTAAAAVARAKAATPEVNDLNVLDHYFKGILLMQADSSEAALAHFEFCQGKLPESYAVPYLVNQSRGAVAFDKQDYDQFLAAAQENLDQDSSSAISWVGVASAYACVYARDGKDSARLLSEQNLSKALSLDSSAEINKYVTRIHHRLSSRQVITEAVYDSLYPHGWQAN